MEQPVQGTVTVAGAGGIGATIGLAMLSRGIRVEFVEADRLRIELARHARVSIRAFDDWWPKPDDAIVLTTKCYDNGVVLDRIPAGATLIPIQNGFDTRLDAFGHASEAIASFVAASRPDRFEPTITRPGELHVGPRGDRPLPARVKELFETVVRSDRFHLKFVPNILPIKHSKLMYNAAISPLAAAAGIDNGALLGDPHARKLFFALINENYSILTANGIELGKVGPFHPRMVAKILRRKWFARLMAKFFEPSLRGTYCSMAGEIVKGRTEIENYNGHLLRLAEGRIAAPLNRAVFELVKRMERDRAQPDRNVLRELSSFV
jgi:2-dehydropantoate 2-reductase